MPARVETTAEASGETIATLSALCESSLSSYGGDIQAALYSLSDEIERLKIWNGQHDVRSGGLDYKLREASDLRNRVLSLLSDLIGITDSAVATNTSALQDDSDDEKAGPYSRRSTEAHGKAPVSSSKSIIDSLSVDSTSLSIDTTCSLPDSLPDLPVVHIHDVITLLFELGPTLLDPTPYDRFEQAVHPDAAQHDINHVRARFPDAEEELIERLGTANWHRRQYLRGLREDREEPSGLAESGHLDLELESLNSETDGGGSFKGATNTRAATTLDSHSGHRELEEEHISSASSSTHSGFRPSVNETRSTAPTELSKQQVERTAQPVTTRYRLPSPPAPNENFTGKSFICRFCSHSVSDIRRPSDWAKHVFNDLEPYMCTYMKCFQSAKTFESRKAWWDHQTERHLVRRAWICTPCKSADHESVFASSESFDEHIDSQHPVKLTSMTLQNIRDLCQREISRDAPSIICPLCLNAVASEDKGDAKAVERSVRRHIADHLEQLALFVAVPAGQMLVKEDDSEFQDDSDFEAGLQSEIRSVASKDTLMSKKEIHLVNVQHFLADQQGVVRIPEPTSKRTDQSTDQPQSSAAAHDRENPDESYHGTVETPSFPVLVQVPPPNEHFYSRRSLPSDVDKGLHSSGLICVLHGKGGVGKTLAAIEYLYAYKEQYDAIFWLQADTAPGLADSYLQLAVALGLASSSADHHQIIARGREWLQETERRWLLIFDNALQWTDVSRYMPNSLQHSNGSVLITTQAEELLTGAQNATDIPIDPLTRKAGADMLLQYLSRDVRTDPERHLANEISTFVGGLPVAIAQVAGYVSYSQYNLEELIETFRQWRKRTGVATDEADDLPAAFREESFSYEGTLAMVWEVTLRELSEDARDVLNVLAYLNCAAAVPKDMLWGMHDDPILEFLDTREKIRMRRINEQLIKRRLVSDNDGIFSIHRSLQRGLQERLSQNKGKQQAVFDQAVALVREVFPRTNGLQQPMPEKWSECQKLLPHLHALHDVYHNHQPHVEGSLDFAQLLLDAGMDQFERGITHEGLTLLKTAEVVLDASPDASPEGSQVMRADIHAMIAIMYDDAGIEKRQEALTRREKALDIRQRTFDNAKTQRRKEEMLVYNSWMEYAMSLLHYHRYARAEPIIQRCLAKFREWGSEEEIPFEYAKYYNKIALVQMYHGRFDEAIRSAGKGVQLMEKTGYSLFSSRFKFDLACIVLQSGDLERALRIHVEVHDQRIRMVGSTNQLSLHSMYAIGAIHELQSRFGEAETWYRRVIEQRRSFTAWPDEAFARAQFHLARVLVAQGKEAEAQGANELREKALGVLDRLLPLDLPSELDGVTDEAVLFDHMLPISPGGPRFTGRGLLHYFGQA